MWAPLLETALLPCPDVEIVLSTSWVPKLGFFRAKAALPVLLQRKVIGATWEASWDDSTRHRYMRSTRYEQIARHVQIMQLAAEDWFAIDNDDFGWPESARAHHLIRCNGDLGLSEPRAQHGLHTKLGLQ